MCIKKERYMYQKKVQISVLNIYIIASSSSNLLLLIVGKKQVSSEKQVSDLNFKLLQTYNYLFIGFQAQH